MVRFFGKHAYIHLYIRIFAYIKIIVAYIYIRMHLYIRNKSWNAELRSGLGFHTSDLIPLRFHRYHCCSCCLVFFTFLFCCYPGKTKRLIFEKNAGNRWKSSDFENLRWIQTFSDIFFLVFENFRRNPAFFKILSKYQTKSSEILFDFFWFFWFFWFFSLVTKATGRCVHNWYLLELIEKLNLIWFFQMFEKCLFFDPVISSVFSSKNAGNCLISLNQTIFQLKKCWKLSDFILTFFQQNQTLSTSKMLEIVWFHLKSQSQTISDFFFCFVFILFFLDLDKSR